MARSLKDTPCEGSTADLKEASRKEDKFYFWDNKRHYLKVPGQDGREAARASTEWIDRNIEAAHWMLMDGDEEGAVAALGRAMHTLMDMTSPCHVDEAGNPRSFPGVLDALGHSCHSPNDHVGSETSEDITEPIFRTNRENLSAACDKVRR